MTNPGLSPEETFTASIAAMVGRLQDKPDKLRAVLNGLALDGSLARAGLPSGLAPMMRLPGPEPERRTRARMAELMLIRYGVSGGVTMDDLLGGGFSPEEITKHKHGAARIAGLDRMAA